MNAQTKCPALANNNLTVYLDDRIHVIEKGSYIYQGDSLKEATDKIKEVDYNARLLN